MKQVGPLPCYHIEVQGWLDASWSDWFDGMDVRTEQDAHGGPITVISGPVRDQAALRGILVKVWSLNLPLLAVTCLSGYGTDTPPAPAPETEPASDK